MADTPNEAPAAPAESEATQNTNIEQNTAPEQTQTQDMHGFTSDQLADMKKFFDANGGFDAIKSKISNPPKAEEKQPEQNENPTSHTETQPVENKPEQPKTPAGAITPSEFLAQQYFRSLSNEEKYAAISKEIADGSILKEMASFNIKAIDDSGNINDQMVRRYLDLKAQTVPAQATSSEPDASAAPTVQYVEVGDTLSSLDQAYQVLSQDAELRAKGLPGHPRIADAEKLIKETLNKK